MKNKDYCVGGEHCEDPKSSSATLITKRKLQPPHQKLITKPPIFKKTASTKHFTAEDTRILAIRKVYYSKSREEIMAKVRLTDGSRQNMRLAKLKKESPKLFTEFLTREVQAALSFDGMDNQHHPKSSVIRFSSTGNTQYY